MTMRRALPYVRLMEASAPCSNAIRAQALHDMNSCGHGQLAQHFQRHSGHQRTGYRRARIRPVGNDYGSQRRDTQLDRQEYDQHAAGDHYISGGVVQRQDPVTLSRDDRRWLTLYAIGLEKKNRTLRARFSAIVELLAPKSRRASELDRKCRILRRIQTYPSVSVRSSPLAPSKSA